MENAEKVREEFEAAYRARYGSISMLWSDAVSGYLSAHAAGAWWAWQASRACLEVELPDTFSPNDYGEWAYWADQVDHAIESAGIKVK